MVLLPKPNAARTRPCRAVLKHAKHIVSNKVKIQENQRSTCTEFKCESMMYLSMSRLLSLRITPYILLQVTRGAENAQGRKGAPKSTRSHETAWNKLRKCPFFALQKNRPKSQPCPLFRPGPGPARPGILRFCTVFDISTLRVQSSAFV